MDTFELRLSFFSLKQIIVLAALFITFAFMGLAILPHIIAMKNQFPASSEIRYLLLLTSAATAFGPLAVALIVVLNKQKKIHIEHNVLTFQEKYVFSGHWENVIMIDVTKITQIGERFKTTLMSTGKSMVPIVHHWLLFSLNDSSVKEVSIGTWNESDIKKFLYYLKGQYPSLIFNTRMVTTTLEEHTKQILSKVSA